MVKDNNSSSSSYTRISLDDLNTKIEDILSTKLASILKENENLKEINSLILTKLNTLIAAMKDQPAATEDAEAIAVEPAVDPAEPVPAVNGSISDDIEFFDMLARHALSSKELELPFETHSTWIQRSNIT